MTHLTRGAFALAVLCVFPIAAVAQQSTGTSPARYVVKDPTADRLFEQAATLELEYSRWGGAAKLYATSADLRTNGDARTLSTTGRVRKPEPARQMFVMAASRALQSGQVHEAAQSYAMAAQLSALGGPCFGNEVGLMNMELALRLSDSPQLTKEQKVTIAERMDIYKKRVRAST